MSKKQKLPKTTIIVVVYNNKDIIDECLQGIQNLIYTNYDCILVDDCSTDGTVEHVAGKYPWVKIIKKRVNSGQAISKNIAIQQSKSKYILFLDSDVKLYKDFLNECVELMERDKNVAICGGKLLFKQKPDKINETGGYLLRIGIGRDRGIGENSLMYNKTEEVFFIGSAAHCIRKDLFDEIGKHDITTSCYGAEDVDICWRARLAGYKVFYNHRAIGYHGFHQTIKSFKPDIVLFHQTKANIRLLIRNYGLVNLIKYLPLAFLISMVDIILFNESRIAKIKAWGWNIVHLNNTLKERKKIQATRKIKDKEILKHMDKGIGKLVLKKLKLAMKIS